MFSKEDRKRINEEIIERMKGVVLFPGSVEEYERFRKYDVETIDTNIRQKQIYPEEKGIDIILNKILLDQGLEAVVNLRYETRYKESIPYGLPVRKKN